MRTLARLWALATVVSLCLPAPSRAGGVALAVIANKSVSIAALGRDELRNIFQTRQVVWPGGLPVRAFNLPDTHPLRWSFDNSVLGLDPARAARYWIDRQVRGGERPPAVVPSPALMVRLIAKTVGSVGYVESALVNPSVKVLARVVDGQVVKP